MVYFVLYQSGPTPTLVLKKSTLRTKDILALFRRLLFVPNQRGVFGFCLFVLLLLKIMIDFVYNFLMAIFSGIPLTH